jgi:hypothetical protein
MGLREYEFNVAPELVAALVRGRPGPLLDRAMMHSANVAEAVGALRESEQNTRIRDEVNAVDGSVEALLHGVKAAIGSARVRGLFDFGRQGLGTQSEVNHLGDVGLNPTHLGPGRNVGHISIGKYGWIRGSTVGDFLLGLRLGQKHHAGLTPDGQVLPDTPPTAAEAERIRLKNYINALDDLIDDQRGNGANTLIRLIDLAESGNGTDQQYSDLLDVYRMWVDLAGYNSEFRQGAMRQLGRVRRDAPDADDSGSSIATSVQAESLFRRLQSVGGLGFKERALSTGRGRVPNILLAVDPAPDGEGDSTAGSLANFRHWSQWLIDPTPFD